MPEKMTKDLQHMLAFVAKKDAVNENDRSILFVISSGKLDRDNERIEQDGLAAAIKDFSKNPAALACHLHRLDNGRSPVIGSWDTDTFVKRADHCEMRLRFAKSELGEEYWGLYRDKHMRAVSIGFIPNEWHEEQTEKTGRVWVIDKLELLEISCVAVGANRQALSKVKGMFEAQQNSETKTIEGLTKKDVTEIIKELLEPIQQQCDEIKCLLTDSDEFAEQMVHDIDSESFVFDGKSYTVQEFEEAMENIKNRNKER